MALLQLLVVAASLLAVLPAANAQALIAYGKSWKWYSQATAPTGAWYSTTYADSTWTSGAGPLGFGHALVKTTIPGTSGGSAIITSYFRTTFTNTAANPSGSLSIACLTAHGVVIYLNGVEVARLNMPSGAVTETTLSSGAISSPSYASALKTSVPFAVGAGPIEGTNTIAVELHQYSTSSTFSLFDMSMNMTLSPSATPSITTSPSRTPTPLPSGSQAQIRWTDFWNYLDTGVDLSATSWKSTTYSDSSWLSGRTPAGYGFAGTITTIDFGPDSSKRFVTTYFRKAFTFTRAAGLTYEGVLLYNLADGVVVYVNGVEIGRMNMPNGTVTSTTLSSAQISTSNNANTNRNMTIPDNLIKTGTNVVAVELHKGSVSSKYLRWNAQLTVATASPSPSPAPGSSASPTPSVSASIVSATRSPSLTRSPKSASSSPLPQSSATTASSSPDPLPSQDSNPGGVSPSPSPAAAESETACACTCAAISCCGALASDKQRECAANGAAGGNSTSSPSSGLSGGAIAGIAASLSGVALLVAGVFVVVALRRRRRRGGNRNSKDVPLPGSKKKGSGGSNKQKSSGKDKRAKGKSGGGGGKSIDVDDNASSNYNRNDDDDDEDNDDDNGSQVPIRWKEKATPANSARAVSRSPPMQQHTRKDAANRNRRDIEFAGDNDALLDFCDSVPTPSPRPRSLHVHTYAQPLSHTQGPEARSPSPRGGGAAAATTASSAPRATSPRAVIRPLPPHLVGRVRPLTQQQVAELQAKGVLPRGPPPRIAAAGSPHNSPPASPRPYPHMQHHQPPPQHSHFQAVSPTMSPAPMSPRMGMHPPPPPPMPTSAMYARPPSPRMAARPMQPPQQHQQQQFQPPLPPPQPYYQQQQPYPQHQQQQQGAGTVHFY